MTLTNCHNCGRPMRVLYPFAVEGMPKQVYQFYTCRAAGCGVGQLVLPWGGVKKDEWERKRDQQ